MDVAGLIVAIFSLIVAIIAFVRADRAAMTANRLSGLALDASYGYLELEMRRALNETNEKISDLSLEMRPFITKAQRSIITDDEKAQLDALELSFTSAIQNWLNVYEDACGKYIDNKVDRNRFKKAFAVEVRNLVERENLKKHFDTVSSRYKAILKVYKEWEDHEK